MLACLHQLIVTSETEYNYLDGFKQLKKNPLYHDKGHEINLLIILKGLNKAYNYF